MQLFVQHCGFKQQQDYSWQKLAPSATQERADDEWSAIVDRFKVQRCVTTEEFSLTLARAGNDLLLVFKVSRLFRVAYLGLKFVQEHVVEEGLRAISISQGIDTHDSTTWKLLAYLHGVMDEMLLTTIADHVRSGQRTIFQMGYVTGAILVGYDAVVVPGAPPTKLGQPRRMPKVNPEVAALIRQHYEWIRDGMSIREGWRRWLKAGGPSDPRSPQRKMSLHAYRRMLSNPRYLGCWAFGRRRNSWSAKRDYTLQIEQPETEVLVRQVEDLRIISDELFHAVQARLAKLKQGPRGPRRHENLHLWDMVIECFYCAACSTPHELVRLHVAGANSEQMRCKRSFQCLAISTINRQVAVQAVCVQLQAHLQQDAHLIEQIVVRAQAIDAAGDEALRQELTAVNKRLTRLNNKYNDLLELVGDGSEDDRAKLKADIRSVQGERSATLVEQARLAKALATSTVTVTPGQVRELLGDLTRLLDDGAAGKLGPDVVYRAVAVFRLLVGDRIMVHTELRPGRKRTNVFGAFTPQTLGAVKQLLEDPRPVTTIPIPEVRVRLRRLPQRERLASRVHELIDLQGLSYRDVAKVLQAEGLKINSGVVWQIYHRYYEMLGQPVPTRPYNNGRRRKPRHDGPA